MMEKFLGPFPMEYIFRNLFVLREFALMLMASTTETYFDCLIIKKGYRYHTIQKAFSKSTTDTQI